MNQALAVVHGPSQGLRGPTNGHLDVAPRATTYPAHPCDSAPNKFTLVRLPHCGRTVRCGNAPIALPHRRSPRSALVDHLWTRPCRWTAAGNAPAAHLLRASARRPNLVVVDPAVPTVVTELSYLPALREPLYLVTDELHVAGDQVAGIFAARCVGARLELAIDVGHSLIGGIELSDRSTERRAVTQWLAASTCFHTMQPEDGPLVVAEVGQALRHVVAQLHMAALAIEASGSVDDVAAKARCALTERGMRWSIGREAGDDRRRAYHDRELREARLRRPSWTDTTS